MSVMYQLGYTRSVGKVWAQTSDSNIPISII